MQKWIGFAAGSLFSVVTILSFSGCSTPTAASGSPVLDPPASGSVKITGIVHGGQQPVSGSVIQLWAVGASGYGSAPTGLISSVNQAIPGVALTDVNGKFNITGTYTCPSGTTQVYLTSTGGNPGLGSANSAINLMYAIGNCSSLNGSTFIFVNEVSTVAAVYALAQFMDPATGNVGYYSTSSSGILNAFTLPTTMFSSITGLANTTTPVAGAAVPQQEIHTLANILAACVNSSGPSSTACATLFSDTTIGSSAPANTLTAMLSIALHPANNVSDLFTNVGGGFAQFAPALSSAPNDFTVALSYNSGAVAPSGLAIDSGGALWIADYGSTGGSSSQWVRLTSTGKGAFSGTAFSNTGTFGLHGVGIDANGSTWGISRDNNTVSKFLVSGAVQGGPFSVGSSPRSIAFDLVNNAWVTNGNANSVSVLSSLGSSIATATGGGLSSPRDIAIDTSGNAWVADHSGSVSAFSLSGSTATALSGSGYTGGGLGSAKAVAIDATNNVWIGSDASSTVISEFNNSGTPVSSSGYSGGGTSTTGAIAFDGSGNLWSANMTTNVLSELGPTGTALTPSTGYQAAALAGIPNFIAIDASGNIWVTTNSTTSVNGVSSNLVEFVGAATPAITPVALALKKGQLNQRPGTPTPIVITTSTLPYYAQGTAYQGRVVATGGNTGSYTFTLASGALPSGMTLATNGSITGTSSDAGTASFTVQATDSTYSYNFTNKALTLPAATSLPAGTNNSELNGKYAVQLSGLKGGTTSSSGAVTGWGALGQLVFDSNGNFTGTMDYNGASTSSSLQISVTGTYSIGSDNRGILLLTAGTTGYLPTELAVSLGNFNSGVAQTMNVEEFDWTGIGSGTAGISNGIGKLQTTGAFTTGTIGQTFVFGMDGESPCNSCNGTVSPYGSISAAGRFVNSGGNFTGQEDAAAIDNRYSGVTFSGTYTNPDATTGRGTITFTSVSGTLFPAPASHLIYYVVNSGELLTLSSDGHTTTSLLVGDALVQTGSFSNATAVGNYIVYEGTPTNGDGSSVYPNSTNLNLISIDFSGTGTATILADKSNQGTVTLENNFGGASLPTAIDASGRLTLNGGGVGTPVFYLANSSGGFGTEAPNSSSTPGMYRVEQQIGSSFSCTSLAGVFSFGTGRTVTEAANNTGTLTISGGTGTGTEDYSDPSGVLASGTSVTETCSTDAYTSSLGRLKFTSGSGSPAVAYIISGSRAVIMDATVGKTTAVLTILQK